MFLFHNHRFKAAILDMDGVITQTAKVHAEAWKKMFDAFLEKQQGKGYKPLSIEQDYKGYIDGKPRFDGIRSFLKSRNIVLPEGHPDDEAGKETVYGLGNQKNQLFLKLLDEVGVHVYPDTLAMLNKWKEEGLKLAVISSSRNCRFVMESAGILDIFDVLVDGLTSEKMQLQGKPAPDIFLTACELLGVSPSDALVVEDAIAGVEAGKKGNFGLVVGVARNGEQKSLQEAGADMVVQKLTMLEDKALAQKPDERFSITYDDWSPEKQKLRESLCTLGNGYFATRGAAEEAGNDGINYPGTYLAGGYNRAQTEVAGRVIENEDFVNFPNWLDLSFRPEGGEWLNLAEYQVLAYRQTLDMKRGLLERDFRVEDREGRRTHVRSRRLVSMRDKHLAGLEWFFTAENWSGKVEIRAGLDGTVTNDNVPRYRELESRHLDPLLTKQVTDDSILLVVQTKQSKIAMAQAARTNLYHHHKLVVPETETIQKEGHISQILIFEAQKGEKYAVEKIIALYTSTDMAISEPSLEAIKEIKRAGRFKDLLLRHEHAYERLWHQADIGIIDRDKVQQLVRLHVFHILQSVSLNTIGMDVGVPARGLHGEAYRGHIFWDELYIFPFLNLRFPEITRSLLMYRYYRLDEARYAAQQEGYKGAMFPWQSGSNGREETQVVHLNPESGRWIPDNTHLQRHVNAAIAYNVWQYYLATDDKQFLSFFGAEIFFSIASFWASMTHYNKARERYEVHGVVGPDEYHTSYPDSEHQGLNNNAYTNVMAAWVLQKGIVILGLIEKSRRRELLKELNIDDQELSLWQEISNKMYVPFIGEGILNQFEGYEKLKAFPWEEYRAKYGDIQRLDRILENEGDNTDKYKASKQADVLMLFYLFSQDELKGIFKKLGYGFSEKMISKNIEYYRVSTSHGSTLSRFVFSWILSKYDTQMSWQNFETLLISDFEDIQGGTTPEGIHLGAMAGSLDLVQRSFAGLEVGEEALWINPSIPENIKKITMRIKYRLHWISVSMDHQKLKISFEEGWSKKVNIGVIDKIYVFKQGEVREFSLLPKAIANGGMK